MTIQQAVLTAVALLALCTVQGCDSYDKGNNKNHENNKHNVSSASSDTIQLNSTPQAADTINVASPDWGIAATLTAMGYPPIATGDIRVWHQWVGKPELPNSVIDLGIRYQPNAELVAQLPVDIVIDNYFYEHARNLYGDIPTESVLFASKDNKATWEDYVVPTQNLGQLINQPEAAKTYITQSQAQIEQAGRQLKQQYPNISKFAVVQFIDANNMRMYTTGSLFNVVFTMMDYELVALDKGNAWGFTPIQLGDLAKLENEVCLIVIEPLSPLTEAELQQSLVWQRLGYADISNNSSTTNSSTTNSSTTNSSTTNSSNAKHSHCMAKIESVWIYGGMSSLTLLADNLASTKLTGGVAQ